MKSSHLLLILICSLFTWVPGYDLAYASPVTIFDASHLLQSSVTDTDVALLTQFFGFQEGAQLNYTSNNTASGYSGALRGTYIGRSIDVNYQGDFSEFSSLGRITWTSHGFYGSVPWSSSGNASIVGDSTSFQIKYDSSLNVGTNLGRDNTVVFGTREPQGVPLGLMFVDTTGTVIANGGALRVFKKTEEYYGDDKYVSDIEILGLKIIVNGPYKKKTSFPNTLEFPINTLVASTTGSANKIGLVPPVGKDTGAQVRIVEKVTFTSGINLGAATIVIGSLLKELGVEGVGELVKGADGVPILPMTLTARPGGKPNAAIFETTSAARPSVRIEIRNRDPQKALFEFSLRVDRASVPAFPELCEGQPLATNLTTSFIMDDGVNPAMAVSTVAPWRCLDLIGGDPEEPRSLRTP
jgi:hypothetical protein